MSGTSAPVLHDVATRDDLDDWGPIPTMIEGLSLTAGKVLSRDPETGIWTCTPGRWACHVTRAEFCHFLSGRATYVHESGETVEVRPGTAAFFPEGWKGECTVRETVRKVYMIA